MNTAVPRKIGASLILGVIGAVVSAAFAYLFYRPKIEFVPLRSQDGRVGLGVVLNSSAWRYAIADSRLPAERAVRLPVARARLSAIVARGVLMDHLEAACHDGWSLVRLDVTPDGSMFVSCYCSQPEATRNAVDKEVM